MVISKFKYWIFLVGLLAVGLTAIGVLIVFNFKDIVKHDTPIYFEILFLIWYLFFWSIIVLGEMRTKCVKVFLNIDYFQKASFFGLGPKEKYYYSELQGYTVSNLYSQGKTYEYLYLIKNEKKIVKISAYYHSNYPELKNIIIARGVVSLGKIKWSFFNELKETFTF